MKCIVGILAAALFVGCGVGVDDPEGQAAAGINYVTATQGLTGSGGYTDPVTGAPGTPPAGLPPGEVPTAIGGPTIGGGGGGTVSAPQDPIPAFERKTQTSNPDPMSATIGTTQQGQQGR